MKQIEQYKSFLELGNKSAHTIRSYVKDLYKLSNYFHLSDASELEKISVEQYEEFYRSLGIADNSLKSLIRNLSAFFTWLIDRKIVSKDNTFSHVKFGKGKFPKVPKKKKVVLTAQEAELLINAGRNIQEKFMLKMMCTTALRRDEICNIKLSDINGCTISIKGKGGDEDDETYLDDDLCKMLNEYLLERDTESQYLFYGTRGFDGEDGRLTGTSVNNRVRACALLSGMSIEKANVTTAHRLRAYAITHMYLKRGMPAAQALARHENQETTKGYIVVGNEFVRELLLGEKNESVSANS